MNMKSSLDGNLSEKPYVWPSMKTSVEQSFTSKMNDRISCHWLCCLQSNSKSSSNCIFHQSLCSQNVRSTLGHQCKNTMYNKHFASIMNDATHAIGCVVCNQSQNHLQIVSSTPSPSLWSSNTNRLFGQSSRYSWWERTAIACDQKVLKRWAFLRWR